VDRPHSNFGSHILLKGQRDDSCTLRMDPNPLNSIPPSVLAILAAEDQSAKTIGLVATFTSLAFITVCLRFYARIRFAIHVGWEDWFIAISMVGFSPSIKDWKLTSSDRSSRFSTQCVRSCRSNKASGSTSSLSICHLLSTACECV
jgi:hypothetical protein